MVDRKNVVCFMVHDDGYILLLKRAKDRGGYWQPPCGGVQEQETLEDAVRREITEETGVPIKAVYSLDRACSYVTMKNGIEMCMQDTFFYTHVNQFHVTLSEEHTEYRWVSFAEGRRLLNWDELQRCVDVVEQEYQRRMCKGW